MYIYEKGYSDINMGLEPLIQTVEKYHNHTVIIFPELIDWNIPLFQRPQQLALSFAKLGVLFIFTTQNMFDNIEDAKVITENCILIPKKLFSQAINLLKKYELDIVLDICSTDNAHSMEWMNNYRNMGCRILYEYIDEISDDITGKVPQMVYERHIEFMKDSTISIVATADKLYNEVIRVRGSEINCLNSSNGVDLDHFRIEPDDRKISESIQKIIHTNKPIIGYYGAIANWFDFEMIEYAAKERKDYEFMMIGPNYWNHDVSCIDSLQTLHNVHFVGAIEYKYLPYTAMHFTVATIPFKLNEITESTSPIKLFEYMAMGKPVVTTAMRECYKYPVVRIAKDKEDYVKALDEAIANTQNDEYIKELSEIAENNSWMKKAEELLMLLNFSNIPCC